MSRNNNLNDVELLAVLRVSIDPWRCAERLGPNFPNIVQSMNAIGHMAAKGVTGIGKEENMAYHKMVRISAEIEAMEKSPSINPEAMPVHSLLAEEQKIFNQFLDLTSRILAPWIRMIIFVYTCIYKYILLYTVYTCIYKYILLYTVYTCIYVYIQVYAKNILYIQVYTSTCHQNFFQTGA